MHSLFLTSLFDELEIRQLTMRTKFTLSIDGEINKSFLSSDETECLSSDHIKWKEIRSDAFEFIKGDRSPALIKAVFSVSPAKAKKILPDAKALFLNIVYSEKKLICTTGISLKTFSLEKKSELIWDEYIGNFLEKNKLK